MNAVAIEDEGKITPWEEEREWASTSPAEFAEIEADLRGLRVGGSRSPPPSSSSSSSSPRTAALGDPAASTCGSSKNADGDRRNELDELFSSSGNRLSLSSNGPRSDDEREAAMLPALERELAAIPECEKMAYLEARRKCPELVDDEHKKAFIWREDYEPQQAARRLVRYWQFKRKLFGPAKCFLPMTLSSAVSDDIPALSAGFLQLLPVKDEHGRTIVFFNSHRQDWTKYSRESMMRAFWYLLHVASADPVDRRRGIVCIVNNLCMTWKQADFASYRGLISVPQKYHPVVGRSFHHCHPTFVFHNVAPVFKMILGERMRKRFQVHYGSVADVLRSLSDFGLGRDRVPEEMGGTVKVDASTWLSDRMAEEGALGWTTSFVPGSLASSKAGPGDDESEGGIDPYLDEDNRNSNAALTSDGKQYREAIEHLSTALSVPNQFGRSLLEVAPLANTKNANDNGVAAVALPKGPSCASHPPIRKQLPEPSFNVVAQEESSEHHRIEPSPPFLAETDYGCQAKSSALPVFLNDPAGSLAQTRAVAGDSKGQDRIDLDLDEDNVESFVALMSEEKQHHRVSSSLPMPICDPPLASNLSGGSVLKDVPSLNLKDTNDYQIPVVDLPKHPSCTDSGPSMSMLPEPTLTVAPRTKPLEGSKVGSSLAFQTRADGGHPASSRGLPKSPNDPAAAPKDTRNEPGPPKQKIRGWRDPRMTRAIRAKTEDPKLSLLDALIAGGFDYPATRPEGQTNKTIKDSEGVSLSQRKNQLCRRLREMRNSYESDRATGTSCACVAAACKSVTNLPNASDGKEIESIGDHFMACLKETKLARPNISLLDALIAERFDFPAYMEKGDDAKGVTLSQMKNQLCHSLKDKRLSDSRLSLAVAAKRSNPHLSLVDALLAGGFKFHQLGADVCDKDILDPGGVSLFTWKNELRKKLTAWERSDCSKRKMDGLVPMGGGDEEIGKPEQSKKRGCKNQSSLTKEQQLTAQHDNIWHNNRRPDILLAHSDEDEEKGQCAHHEGIKRSTSFDKDIEELPGLDELPVGFKDDFTMIPGFWGLEGMN